MAGCGELVGGLSVRLANDCANVSGRARTGLLRLTGLMSALCDRLVLELPFQDVVLNATNNTKSTNENCMPPKFVTFVPFVV